MFFDDRNGQKPLDKYKNSSLNISSHGMPILYLQHEHIIRRQPGPFLAGEKEQQLPPRDHNEAMTAVLGTNWTALEPKHDSNSLYCATLMADVPPGTFLALSNGKIVRTIGPLNRHKKRK